MAQDPAPLLAVLPGIHISTHFIIHTVGHINICIQYDYYTGINEVSALCLGLGIHYAL